MPEQPNEKKAPCASHGAWSSTVIERRPIAVHEETRESLGQRHHSAPANLNSGW